MLAVLAVALVGAIHCTALWKAGKTPEAWAVGALWALTIAVTWAVTADAEPDLVRSVLQKAFGGLSLWLQGR